MPRRQKRQRDVLDVRDMPAKRQETSDRVPEPRNEKKQIKQNVRKCRK
jgi:hypothetical protein